MATHQATRVTRHQSYRQDLYDPYYSPTSPVGLVRAERVKYLFGFSIPPRGQWEHAEQIDPSQDTLVDPQHEAEGAQQLLDYYEAVRHDRRVRRVAIAIAFLGIGGVSALVGWLLSNLMVGTFGVVVGICIAYWILVGEITLPGKAGAALSELKESGHFRERGLLSGYLVTTHDPAVTWEAAGLEQRRQHVENAATRLRGHSHLPAHREAEIAQLQNQGQELRRRLVDMLDPQRPDTTDSSEDELLAATNQER